MFMSIPFISRFHLSLSSIDQVRLIKQIIEHWNSGCLSQPSNMSTTSSSSPALLPSITQLSHQFTEWFYTSWNNLSSFTSDHFFPDCQLTLFHENQRQIFGSYYVCELLRAYVTSQDLRFSPNIQSNKVEESRHGLVLIQVHGTIHQRGTCVGIFDQSFGLIRDPTHNHNYLIKFSFLNLLTQQAYQQQLLSSNMPTPSYLIDIMQNYDKQVDSADYVIDEGDSD